MPHLTSANHHTLTITGISPSATVKRRRGEELHVTLTLETPKPPSECRVEAWTDVNEETPRAIPLEHKETLGDQERFKATIPLETTGRHTLRLRARHEDDNLWVWAAGEDDPAANVHVDPAYTYDAIVYNAFVRYFGARTVDEDGSVHRVEPGTFGDVEDHAERLSDLGVNVLYLNPVHQIGELYKNYNPHDALPEYLQPGCPYSVKDYRSIDPELSFGFEDSQGRHPFDEFQSLIDAAHDNGIRVYMDLVFNHCAHDSVFQRRHPEWFLYKDDPWSLDEAFIHPEELQDGKPWGDPEHTMSPYDHGNWWEDAAQLNWNNLTSIPDEAFHGDNPYRDAENEPPCNPTIDEMYDYFTNIVTFWIEEFGIDGFRCDVAYRVPTDFWSQCIDAARRAAKEAHPENGSLDGDVVFIAEDYHVKCKELLEAGFTACYGDYSNKLGDADTLKHHLDYMYNVNDDNVPDGSQWFIFPECHDFHRNPTKIAEQFRDEHRDADLNANKSRWTLTATLPGIPMIFNGFEKLEWEPASLFSYSTIDWESDKDISEHIEQVNHVRHRLLALQQGSYEYVPTSKPLSDEDIFTFIRRHDDTDVIVAVNMDVKAEAATTMHLPDDFSGDYELKDELTGEQYQRTGREVFISLPAGEAHIFTVNHASSTQ